MPFLHAWIKMLDEIIAKFTDYEKLLVKLTADGGAKCTGRVSFL